MDDFVMHYVAIMPSYICTLNCKLCIAGVPYFPHPTPTPIGRVKEYIDRYFRIVTFVKKFTISGGEPLLYPSMPEILRFLQDYADRIEKLEILTSGTVLPTEDLLAAAAPYGDQFRFMIDNYGPELSKKIPELDALLNQAGIQHMIRNYTHDDPHCGGWVDFGDLTEKKLETQAEIEARYSQCTYPQKLKFALTIHDGVMYPCPPCRRCSELGIVSDSKEYIDLFDDALSIEDQREKIRAILNGKSLRACAYCNGMSDSSPRFYPAEQLTRGQLDRVKAVK